MQAAENGQKGRALAPEGLGPTVSIGEILVEIVASTRGAGFRDAQPLVGPYPSGAPAIFIDQCGRMGGAAALVGAVGADDFGHLVLDRLGRDGVDVGAVAMDPDYPTGTAFVRYRPDGERDFVFNIAKSAAARLAWTGAARVLIARAGHLHVMGSALSMPGVGEMIEDAAGVIKARGGSLSMDPNLRKELAQDAETRARFGRLLAMTDVLLPSGAELTQAAGQGSEDAALRHLFGLGISEIVVKRGALGATAFGRDGWQIDAPAFLVDERDPTGAGDCFGGAYVACRRMGMPVAQALTYATAAGARNVTREGPMEGAGTRAELDAFIASCPRRG